MMKILSALLTLPVIFSLTACGQNTVKETQQSNTSNVQNLQENESPKETFDKNKKESSILIAYFGRWGNTEFPDGIDASASASIVLGTDNNFQGTTEYVASLIQKNAGGDLHLIQTADKYPADYDATVEQNHQEQEEGYIPTLQNVVENMEQYDTIFIGYPIWATTIPQPVVSFLKQYDFSEKKIIPFCTHAGYGSGDSFTKIQELCPNSEVLDGFAAEAEEIRSAEQEIPAWLNELQIGQKKDVQVADSTEIIITVDSTEITAELNNSEAAREFAAMLPITISTTRMGEHEYYGSLQTPLTHTDMLQTGYKVGDLAFWTPGDLFAIYFDEPEDAPEGLMILGHITSDMSVFENMAGSVEMHIRAAGSETRSYAKNKPLQDVTAEARVRLTFDGGEAVVRLENNAAAKDFLSRLPMTQTFEDFNSIEKICRLPDEITTESMETGIDPDIADVTLYVPWNTLVFYYEDYGYNEDLIPMGHVESGMELLAKMGDAFTVSMERMEDNEQAPTEIQAETVGITMTAGDTVITADLSDSGITRAFLKTLPRTFTMNRYGDREYYGRMEAISEDGETIADFDNGDVTYYPAGPSFAVFFDNADTSSQSGLIRMGKITSDLSVFNTLGATVEMRVEIQDK